MQTPYGHLTYCTNIHPGESWQEHFNEIKKSIPEIKSKISPILPFGIGLRLSNSASIELSQNNNLETFKTWMTQNNCYVFTINGFPFGNFHQHPVKENVYRPDWTTEQRVLYTFRLFDILKEILPEGMEGSISTSPLSYRHWFKAGEETNAIIEKCTENILEVVIHLINIYIKTGKILHLNIEPEPDGLLENSFEFIGWYNQYYVPMGIRVLEKKGIINDPETILRRHVQLCYDVCHSALAYENIEQVSAALKQNRISIGKVQISSALKIDLTNNREEKIKKLSAFNEPVYLHQVIARDIENELYKFTDLPDALNHLTDEKYQECRIHFHVPVFSKNYGLLSSTQENIVQTLDYHRLENICNHWEVETYTWNILPEEFQLPMNKSIVRELEWVLTI